jgi:polyisoprenoid-binding protein YceI
MIEVMALSPGTHAVGPPSSTLRIHTYREGMAQKVGHDLVIDVGEWEAKVEVEAAGIPTAVTLRANPRSLTVREGRRGVKPLTGPDRDEIHSNIDKTVLRGQSIAFESSGIELAATRLKVHGQLTIAGTTREVSFELELSDEGRVTGRLPVSQTEWGIKPYRAFMGALRVRDDVEVLLEANLPSA